MANFDNIHELIDETIYPNSAGEINATEHNAMLHDVVDAVNTKKADQDDLEQEIEDRESHDDLIWQSLFQSWASSTAYKVGDIRRYEGGLYICTTAHTSGLSFDSSKWDYYSGATIKQMIDGITAKIPAGATSTNKLVDKATMILEIGQNITESLNDFQADITDPLDDRIAAVEGKIPADASSSNKLATADDVVDAINEAIEPLENDGYLYAGVVTPTSAAPTATGKVFVLASTAGTYTNFGNLVVNEGEVAILKYNGTAWSKDVTGIEKISITQNTETGGYDIAVGGGTPIVVPGQGDLYGGDKSIDHSDVAFSEVKAMWVVTSGQIDYVDDPSSSAIRAISTPIALAKGHTVTIQTATNSKNINAYIVTDVNGSVLAHETPEAGSVVYEFTYEASADCLVYINKLTSKDFECVEEWSEVGDINSIRENIEEIVGTPVTIDHTSDEFSAEKSIWHIVDNAVEIYTSPSSEVIRCNVSPVELSKGESIHIKTAVYAASVRSFIVSDIDRNVIFSQLPSDAFTEDDFTYVADEDCLVFINKLTTRAFACSVSYIDGGRLSVLEMDMKDIKPRLWELEELRDYFMRGAYEKSIEMAFNPSSYNYYQIFAQKGDAVIIKRESQSIGDQIIVRAYFSDGSYLMRTIEETTSEDEFTFAELPFDLDYIRIYYGSTATRGNENVTFKVINQNKVISKGSYQFGVGLSGYRQVTNIDALPEDYADLDTWYDLYDGLLAQYPNYITKVDCDAIMESAGISAPAELSGLPIYMYKFVPPRPKKGSTDTEGNMPPYSKRLKIMIVTGTHPEYMAIHDCYQMMNLICNSWKSDDNLAALRWDAEIYVIPCSGPWGIVNSSRVNYNGVDLNRNMASWNWKLVGAGTDTYSGPSAGSEYESKLLAKMIEDVTPDIFIDHHNFYQTSSKNQMFITCGKQMGWDIGAGHIRVMSRKWASQYDDFPDNDDNSNDHFFGYYDVTPTNGTRESYANERDIFGFTFESSAFVNYVDGEFVAGQNRYNGFASTIATDGFLNFVLRVCKTFSETL